MTMRKRLTAVCTALVLLFVFAAPQQPALAANKNDGTTINLSGNTTYFSGGIYYGHSFGDGETALSKLGVVGTPNLTIPNSIYVDYFAKTNLDYYYSDSDNTFHFYDRYGGDNYMHRAKKTYAVTSIGDNAVTASFSFADFNGSLGCAPTTIVSITLPNKLKTIGKGAFAACTSLVTVEMPPSVIAIGAGAFANTANLTIRGKSGSYAETYATENGINFVSTGTYDPANPGSSSGGGSSGGGTWTGEPMDTNEYTVTPSSSDISDVSLDLAKEMLSYPDFFVCGAYSLDGGTTWKKGSPMDSEPVFAFGYTMGSITKILNKGCALVLAEGYDKTARQPLGNKITFPNISPRPTIDKYMVNYVAAHMTDGTLEYEADTINQWVVTAKNSNVPVTGLMVAPSTNGKNASGVWSEFPSGGISVAPLPDSGKADKSTYLVAKLPVATGSSIMPRSKMLKLQVSSAIKAPTYKTKGDARSLIFKKGVAVFEGVNTTVFSEAPKEPYVVAGSELSVKYILLPTDKKPASTIATIEFE